MNRSGKWFNSYYMGISWVHVSRVSRTKGWLDSSCRNYFYKAY